MKSQLCFAVIALAGLTLASGPLSARQPVKEGASATTVQERQSTRQEQMKTTVTEKCGDMNGDNVIDATDAKLCAETDVKAKTVILCDRDGDKILSESEKENCGDLNGDGKIDAADKDLAKKQSPHAPSP